MSEKGQPEFPKGVDMPEKLRQLESRQKLFWDMCKPEKRAKYIYCQDSKLVRIVLELIVLEHVSSDYAGCVSRLLDRVPLIKEVSAVRHEYDEVEGSEAGYTDISDAHDHSFNGYWLPEWRLLRGALNNEYKRLESLKVPVKRTQAKLPVAFGGTDRQGAWCCACGGKGHKKGSQERKVDKFDVHEPALGDFKKRVLAKKKKDGRYSPGSSRSGAVLKSEKP